MKSKDNLINTSQKIKKEINDNDNNNNIKKTQKINIKETKDVNQNTINHGLKKTKTVEQFSTVKSQGISCIAARISLVRSRCSLTRMLHISFLSQMNGQLVFFAVESVTLIVFLHEQDVNLL